MPGQRAKHKKHIQAWIDAKVLAAFDKAARAAGLTRAEYLERLLAEQLEVEPRDIQTARSGLPSGKQRLSHGRRGSRPKD